jgi:hypothetical protein
MSSELTTEILVQIRDEIRGMRTDLGARIDRTNERLDRSNERLDRVVQEQIRQATAIVELEQGQREMHSSQREIVGELKRLNSRIDNVLTGTMGQQVRMQAETVS